MGDDVVRSVALDEFVILLFEAVIFAILLVKIIDVVAVALTNVALFVANCVALAKVSVPGIVVVGSSTISFDGMVHCSKFVWVNE